MPRKLNRSEEALIRMAANHVCARGIDADQFRVLAYVIVRDYRVDLPSLRALQPAAVAYAVREHYDSLHSLPTNAVVADVA